MNLADLPARLAEIEQQGLYRQRRLLDAPGIELRSPDGAALLNFSSNDYLGLAAHPKVIEAMREGATRYGVGSRASHLVTGHCSAHHALEEELADFTGRERALLFSTGYMANLGVTAALAGRGDWLFEDRLNHASLLDGALLSGARLKRFPHRDVSELRRLLVDCLCEGPLIVTDGVFSMDGDLAPLSQMAALAKEFGAVLMVDDAHGFGVLGATGGGLVEQAQLSSEAVPVLIGTLGKAFGTFGAFVAGSADLIEFLIQRARPYIYTTALPPAVAEATRASLRLLREESWRRDHLSALVAHFRAGAAHLGLSLLPSETPIQPILLGDNEKAMEAGEHLLQAGLLVSAIRPPTVPTGSARLRVTFSADHQLAQVDRLLDALSTLPD